MMKKRAKLCIGILSVVLLTGCTAEVQSVQSGSQTQPQIAAEQTTESRGEQKTEQPVAQTEAGENADKILIAYFTRLDNTDADMDTVIQGGGPYGPLGNSMEDADLDAVSSASITVRENGISGNTQAAAEMIQETVGGTLFSIQTVQDYPADYSELIDYGESERSGNARPELLNHVENMEEYEIIFLGFPNWWFDMPMPIYSFLEEYDFTGKRVIPFVTSASSGFSGTIGSISERIPEAMVEENGIHIQMAEIANAKPQVEEWLNTLGLGEEKANGSE